MKRAIDRTTDGKHYRLNRQTERKIDRMTDRHIETYRYKHYLNCMPINPFLLINCKLIFLSLSLSINIYTANMSTKKTRKVSRTKKH